MNKKTSFTFIFVGGTVISKTKRVRVSISLP